MQEGFDREFSALSPPPRYVFEHESARLLFEADIFWATEAIEQQYLFPGWVFINSLATWNNVALWR